MKKITDYFEKEVLRKRRYLSEEICRKVIKNPIKKEIQSDGRIRFWGKVEELEGKYIRLLPWKTVSPSTMLLLTEGINLREGIRDEN